MASNEQAGTGVLATVRREGGKVRLVLHDARAQSGGASWTSHNMYTHVEFDASAFSKTQLSEKELANIGLALVTRLAALAKA